MVDQENLDLLKYSNYLLSTYQLAIYRELSLFMESNKLMKKDIAKQLDVSSSYVSQILNGKFNFTLKKLVELGIAINKVPYLEFIEKDEYFRREKYGFNNAASINIFLMQGVADGVRPHPSNASAGFIQVSAQQELSLS